MKHVVEISKSALTQMLLSGFEAFIIKHGERKRSGIEFHASLFGDIHLKKNIWTHKIEFISPATSAKMSSGSVWCSEEVSDLKEHISEQLGYYYLGTMHSHPYLRHEMDLDEVRNNGCDFSASDLNCFSHEIDRYESGQGYHLEVLLTIKHMYREVKKTDGRKAVNVFEFSVGNCKCFLKAQVFSKDEDGILVWDETELVCEFLDLGLHLDAEFGRVNPRLKKKRLLEYKPT